MAPSASVRLLSGTMRSGSTSSREPSPAQSGHAPYGLLNEKSRGASSSMDTPCTGHASAWENDISSPSMTSISTVPSASLRATSTLSARRDLMPVLHRKPIDDHLDIVSVLLVESDLLVERAHLAVDPSASETLGLELVEHLAVLALAPLHDRREHLELRAGLQLHDAIDDLVGCLPLDGSAARRAVRDTDAREQQTQVVIDLCHGAHGRARVPARRLLVDGDRRGEPLDVVDVGLVHLAEELPCVGRERLDVATLPLGIDRVEGQRGLARTGQPGDHDQLVARDIEVEALEVVLAGTANGDVLQ